MQGAYQAQADSRTPYALLFGVEAVGKADRPSRTKPRVTKPTMNARDSSPGEGHDSDGEEEKSIARTIVEDEIPEIDRHTNRAGTAAVRSGREDLLEELTEHLRGLADWLDEEVDVDDVDDADDEFQADDADDGADDDDDT